MKSARSLVSVLILMIIAQARSGHALPMIEEPVPLPAAFTGVVTIMPDSHNTATHRSYWLVPSVARIVRNQDQKLSFGLVHSGISGFDPDGINALLNITVQPYVDEATLAEAKRLVEEQARANGAEEVGFRFVAPTEMTAQILVGGQFYDCNGQDKATIAGGSIEAGIPFQVNINKSFDVRALSQAGGDDASTIGALFTMRYNGVGNRCHFFVTANVKEIFEHWKAQVSGTAWWGLVRANAAAEWQNLQTNGLAKLTVVQCEETTLAKYDPNKILDGLMEQVSNRTGFFAKRLQASGLPDAPGGVGNSDGALVPAEDSKATKRMRNSSMRSTCRPRGSPTP
jgi:hypothetical protein